jgi:hypothetical protein
MIRYGKLLAAAGVVSASAAAILIPAGTFGAFSTGQTFHGEVNGSASGATVTVVCPGVQTTGTVKTGQTWNVLAGGSGVVGSTGSHNITASFTGVVGGPTSTWTSFSGAQAIPTSPGGVPCTGPGSVTFTSGGQNHTANTVTVTFVKVAS